MEKLIRTTFSCRRDGLVIRGTEYRLPGGVRPAAIVSHGFMANQGTVRKYARFLARKGYAACCFDFCGGCVLGGRSDGDTTRMSVLTEVKDLLAVVAFVRSLPHTDGGPVTLMGCSQGGFVSALAAAQHPEMVRQLILFYPALCIPDDARAGKMMWARFDPQHVPEEFSCGPMKLGRCYAKDAMTLSPMDELTAYPGDVLILHGDRDGIVPADYSKSAESAYRSSRLHQEQAGCVRLEMLPGAGHGFSGRGDRDAMRIVAEFLA